MNKKKEKKEETPKTLEVNVKDAVSGKDLGPGQKK